jgi:hypothetical protein
MSLPPEVIEMLASREMRLHHYLWHETRNTWNSLEQTDKDKIKQLGWEPPNPALDNRGSPLRDNFSGEDFLYMHQQMIAKVNARLDTLKRPHLKGWAHVPEPGSSDPVPPLYDLGSPASNQSLARMKSDEFYWEEMKPRIDRLEDLDYLRQLTLSQLGSDIEWTLHNWMHMRWSARPKLIRPNAGLSDIDPKFDNPNYNWLGDPYSSHVNPIFWKLHGWVDDRIEDWQRANKVQTISWRGRWDGKTLTPNARTLSTHSASRFGNFLPSYENYPQQEHLKLMEKVLKILLKSGQCSNFYDNILLPEELEPYCTIGSCAIV